MLMLPRLVYNKVSLMVNPDYLAPTVLLLTKFNYLLRLV